MLPVERAVAFEGLRGVTSWASCIMAWDNMVSMSCETFINSNPATSPSWFSGRTDSGRIMSKMCRISLWMPRETGRRLWIRAVARRVSRAGGNQSGFFFAFAAGGFKRGFAAGNAAADEVVEFVGIDGFVRAAAAIQKCQPPSVCTSPVEVDGLAHESERAEGGAFQRKENLARVVAHVKLFVAPAVQQSEAFPFVRQVLQTVAHRQPVVRLQAEVV